MNTAEVIAHYRTLRGLSRLQLAEMAGVSERQIWRYEDAEEPAAPTLPVADRLAAALGVSLSTLAGHGAPEVDLSGVWYTAWQTWMDDVERIEHERVTIAQEGTFLQITGEPDPGHTDTGSYPWTGELRLLRDRCLSGWYAATAEGIGSNGAIHLVLHSHGQYALGRWMGMSHDGISESGWGAMARTVPMAERAIDSIIGTVGTLKTWPDMSDIEFPEREV
ncbi:helix-turn-helix transcriptional regulator [Nocardia wallacei]|uniref:helix-turn-helix transcriptional regulator n=1 Tax=Nocardia wallacei TaxID=480035 RepID=UPI0024577114|nr:helix-turn-helix transcriptional regulator [Nocardia wallacei]